jgi:glycosyltransferase involved in cell wall biosynthesis
MKIKIYDAGQRENPTSGYGLMSSQIGMNLKQLGHEVIYFPSDEQYDCVFWIRPPHYVKYPEFKPEDINIIYTMHEGETFEDWKSDWPELLNRCDAVVVPTEWNKRVFINQGVKVPVYVIPLGVNSKDFHGAKTYEFSIMTLHNALGSDISRENWKDTLRAFFGAFYNNHEKEVMLNIKSYNIKYDKYGEFVDEITAGMVTSKLPLVNIIELDLVTEDLNKLYTKHWLFVKNSNREGWSLPLWEAISAGIRVAHTDLPVFECVPPTKSIRFKVGDVEGLKSIFLEEFRHWKKQKGFINSFNWRANALKLEDVIKQTKKA